jgi:hypothetical protein
MSLLVYKVYATIQRVYEILLQRFWIKSWNHRFHSISLKYVHHQPQLGQLAVDPLGDVLNPDFPVRGGQIQLIPGHHDRYVLVVPPLLPDLLETLLDAVERWRRRDGVDEQESVSCGDAEPPHRRKLHVPCGVQNVHLEGHVPQVILAVVEVLDGAAVLVRVGVHQEAFDYAALADTGPAEDDQANALVVGHGGAVVVHRRGANSDFSDGFISAFLGIGSDFN